MYIISTHVCMRNYVLNALNRIQRTQIFSREKRSSICICVLRVCALCRRRRRRALKSIKDNLTHTLSPLLTIARNTRATIHFII